MPNPTVFILARSKKRKNWSGFLERRLRRLGVPVYRVTPNTVPKFRPERVKLVINYGCGTTPVWWGRLPADVVVLNTPEQVSVSCNKVSMQAHLPAGNRLLFTTDKSNAQQTITNGGTIVSRTILNGHSGAGIVLSPPEPLPDAELYTVLKRGRNINEYRVWFNGNNTIDVAQKRRYNTERLNALGIDRNDRYGQVVRAHKFGWAFTRNDMNVTDTELFGTIVRASTAVITWGCVDVLIDSETRDWWIVETNTAPGMSDRRTRTAIINSLMTTTQEVL